MGSILLAIFLVVFAVAAALVGDCVASSRRTFTCRCGAKVARDVIIVEHGYSRVGADFILGGSADRRWSELLSGQCEVCRDRRRRRGEGIKG